MTTSALQFQKMLMLSSEGVIGAESFLDSLADFLGFEGPLARSDAAYQVQLVFDQIRQDVDLLDLPEEEFEKIKRKLDQFKGVSNHSALHLRLEDARKQFLSPVALLGLTVVHDALEGKVERTNVTGEITGLVSDADQLLEKIENLEIPREASMIFKSRILQVKIALENFKYLGAENLSRSLEDLAGALVVRSQNLDSESQNSLKGIKDFTSNGLAALNAASKATKNSNDLIENLPKLTEWAGNLISGGGSGT